MEIYTIGFTKKSAAKFFETLKRAGIKCLIDIRLNNQSQLAGFTKQEDLRYFLEKICKIKYIHDIRLAPTKELIQEYREKKMSWEVYENRFIELLKERQIIKSISKNQFNRPTVLLCSEDKPDYCHRRIVAEFICRDWDNVSIVHL